MSATQFFGFLDEEPGGDKHLPGDASQTGSILMFWAFWAIFDRWKGCLNH